MIVGATVALRPFDRRHLDATRAWVNDPEHAALLDRALPVGDREHERWYEAQLGRDDRVWLAIETLAEGRHVGNVWLWAVDARHRRAEVRIVVGDRAAHGRGLGREAIDLVARYAFERLNLHRVYAYVLASNTRAVRAFEQAGFLREGLLRQDRWVGDHYDDAHLLARLR